MKSYLLLPFILILFTGILTLKQSDYEMVPLYLWYIVELKKNWNGGFKWDIDTSDPMESVDIELVELILSNGGDVNETAISGDIEGWTPIHYAVSNRNEDLVRFLVKNGSNVNARTKDGLTPFSIAES